MKIEQTKNTLTPTNAPDALYRANHIIHTVYQIVALGTTLCNEEAVCNGLFNRTTIISR
ncbi:MAG: hypothetical protein WBM13_06300 [Bacteroidia bacterium]